MRVFVGVLIGVALGAGGAVASPLRTVYMGGGDRAVANMGETVCTVAAHAGSRPGFVCQVGGDYRARYGVIVNEREVAITRYSTSTRYRVLVARRQAPVR